MRRQNLRSQVAALLALAIIFVICVSLRSMENELGKILGKQSGHSQDPNRIVLALVSCGGRYGEALTLIKSAVLFRRGILLHVIVVVDDEHFVTVADSVKSLAEDAANAKIYFTFEMQRTWFPPGNEEAMSKLYAPCSAQRIFFPSLLSHIDSLIYMDSDSFFISPVQGLWENFKKMNKTQWLAAAYEDEPTSDGWYNTKAKIPYYGSRGLNSGVMLLNLTRMRQLDIENRALEVHEQYKEDLRWGDQDIFNVILHSHPEYAFRLPCEYNFRTSHCYCRYAGNCSCKTASNQGVRIVHGNLKAFLTTEYPFFRNIFEAMKHIPLREDAIESLKMKFTKTYDGSFQKGHGCVNSSQTFFKNLMSR